MLVMVTNGEGLFVNRAID